MPELVEVETTKRDLYNKIRNKKINNVEVFLDKIVYHKKESFINDICGEIINDVKRRGKWLLIELDKSYIVVHFRMEGRFYLKEKNTVKDKHDYVIFYFDKFSLHYNDPRLFGKLEVISKDKIEEFFKEKKLGLEYNDEKLTPLYLKEKFKNHYTAIKSMLLDQSYITGIGNIYADEILFESKINPKTQANKLSKNKLQDIIDNTKIVFENSLKHKGTYPNIDGSVGTFENFLKVHKRKGKKCYVCDSIIKKETVGGRGTYYCPLCQKKY